MGKRLIKLGAKRQKNFVCPPCMKLHSSRPSYTHAWVAFSCACATERGPGLWLQENGNISTLSCVTFTTNSTIRFILWDQIPAAGTLCS